MSASWLAKYQDARLIIRLRKVNNVGILVGKHKIEELKLRVDSLMENGSERTC